MSWSLRRAVFTLGPVALCCTSAVVLQVNVGLARQPVQAKIQPIKAKLPPIGIDVPQPPKPPNEFAAAIELPRSPDATRALEAAQDYIKAEDWATACDTLQKLLIRPEDFFTKVAVKGPDGKEALPRWISVKSEAGRLLGTLPANGMEFYKLTYGVTAAELLKEAKSNSDVEKLTLITRYYLHTDAGAEASSLLATYHLDRANYTAAALCYEKLLSREDNDKLNSTTLFRAAYAFQNTGDKANEDLCWQKLNTRQRELRLPGGVTKTVEELREYIVKNGRGVNELIAWDTPMVGGGASRSFQSPGGPAFLQATWKQALSRTPESANWIKTAEDALLRRGQPILSAMQPITATVLHNDQKLSLVVFRSHWGIHAVDMKSGKLKWDSASDWSMDRMLRDAKKVLAITTWVNGHLVTRPSLILENSTVGTLSTDGSFAFSIDDFAVPPANQNVNFDDGSGRMQNFGDESIESANKASRLQAFDLYTGKLIWVLGGDQKKNPKTELADSYFLGAPLPLGGKLYVLTEKAQDLRLACLDPLTGKLLSVQTLATARDKMSADVWRRVQATHLAYGEGILICPTNSGAILGVDLLSNSLVWAYPYRDKGGEGEAQTDVVNPRFGRGRGGIQPQPGWVIGPDGQYHNPNISTQWKVSPPVIVEGKVVFTAPDSSKIHCINLRDGSHVWSQQRAADDIYFAGVYHGKAIVVGKNYVKAFSLAKGELVWNLPTGVPSGYGVASDNVYYLPLKEAGQNKEPEICAIDLEKGQIKAHTKSRLKDVPGNLLFYEGDVLSQTPLEIVSYPQLAIQLARIDKAIGENPNDPDGLYRRGQLRLDKGDLVGAIDDLRRSLKNTPPKELLPSVREKLYDTFTEYFQRDFNKAEEFFSEYEELCKVDLSTAVNEDEKKRLEGDQRRRRANFLCLVAKGKEAQGKLVEAFQRYQEFAAEAAAGEELISVVDEPTVKATPEVWSGGRIAAMVAKAKPADRKPLEDLLNVKWNELKKTTDVNEIRNFVRIFGSLFNVGKEARLELAARLMEEPAAVALLEAEQQLALLRVSGEDPALAGRAVEMLARLNTRKGLLEDASYYYRLLRDDFAKVPVRDGKTGAELYNEMATDKRLLPHLDIPAHSGVTGKYLSVKDERGTYQYNQQLYDFGQVGEKLPFFQKHRIGLQFGDHSLKITDALTGEVKSKPLTRTNFQNMIYGNGQPNLPKYTYMTSGHLVVLPVAHMVFGIDPIQGTVLWERNLYGDKNPIPGQPGIGGVPAWNQFIVDPKDNSIQLMYPDGWVQRLAGSGTLEGSSLCLQTRDGLIAIDPVTNKTLWTRTSINSRCQIFNDDQYVYVVELGSDNNPASTRVLRAYDGVSVNVPDFTAQYLKRVRQIGRNLLLSETDAKGQATYRLYDVLTGKDLWTATFAANAHVLKPEDNDYVGVVEPDGQVRVVDVRTGKDALKAKVDPKHLEKLLSAHLLFDGQYFFVAFNGSGDPALNQGGVQTNLMPGTGMRSVAVNGDVYCFDAQTGKMKWCNPLLNQMIILDHFADMPVVIATSRFNRINQVGVGRQVQQVVALEIISKRTGKFEYKQENQNWQQFHALSVDPKKNTIELTNYQSKIVVAASNEPPPMK